MIFNKKYRSYLPKIGHKGEIMGFYIAIFRSRTDAMILNDELKKRGVNAKIIPTPERAAVGCGLSVKFYGDEYAVIALARRLRLSGFAGIIKA